MKKLLSTFLFLLFLIFVSLFYLSFFGYETDRFNQVIKSKMKESQNNFEIDFTKISVFLDIKKLTLFVKFIDPKIKYNNASLPLKTLRTDINLEPLVRKKLIIKRAELSTEFLDFNKIKKLLKKNDQQIPGFKKIKSANLKIESLELIFDEDFKFNKDYKVIGKIKNVGIILSEEYEIKNLSSNFFYKNNNIKLNDTSFNINNFSKDSKNFYNGELELSQKDKKYDIDFKFNVKNLSNFFKIPGINYSLPNNESSLVKAQISIIKNIIFKNLLIEDKNNQFKVKNIKFSKDLNLINFQEISIKTSIDNKINNEFKILNKKNEINIKGQVFDAKNILNELKKNRNKNNFLKNTNKNIEIDFDRVEKVAEFPIRKFRLIGKIKNGDFEKITAKSDFSNDEHLDISLKKQKETDEKILEIYSDIATPLLNDYKFFKGLDGGNLTYTSKFNNKKSFGELIINNFKLNDAPVLAKIFSLADLRGLTDTLKGEGISFDTLSIKFVSDESTMTIDEIFMIGPSVSVLVDGYVENKSGLVSLRGTLVPAKQLNKIVSKIPIVGEILVGKKVGEGVFGLSFKIKGLPDNLKTTVNPVKTLAPRFITRAVEAAKKRRSKQP